MAVPCVRWPGSWSPPTSRPRARRPRRDAARASSVACSWFLLLCGRHPDPALTSDHGEGPPPRACSRVTRVVVPPPPPGGLYPVGAARRTQSSPAVTVNVDSHGRSSGRSMLVPGATVGARHAGRARAHRRVDEQLVTDEPVPHLGDLVAGADAGEVRGRRRRRWSPTAATATCFTCRVRLDAAADRHPVADLGRRHGGQRLVIAGEDRGHHRRRRCPHGGRSPTGRLKAAAGGRCWNPQPPRRRPGSQQFRWWTNPRDRRTGRPGHDRRNRAAAAAPRPRRSRRRRPPWSRTDGAPRARAATPDAARACGPAQRRGRADR